MALGHGGDGCQLRRGGACFVLRLWAAGSWIADRLSFLFNLVATNGKVIATSEAYESKASALKVIESVKRNAPNAEIDDQTDT